MQSAKKPPHPNASPPRPKVFISITMTRFTTETQNAERGDEEKGGACDLSAERFARLRAWRSGRARRDGMPPYILFHVREFAELARRNPDSRATPGVRPAT